MKKSHIVMLLTFMLLILNPLVGRCHACPWKGEKIWPE